MMKKVLLIIPAYNEAENIAAVCARIEDFRRGHTDPRYTVDYIVINDGSADDTEQICRRNHIPVITLARNLGIGGAVQTGYKYAERAGYSIAVQFDGDGQHDIFSLPALLEPILAGDTDLAVGSRFIEPNSNEFQSTFMRRVGIRFLSRLIRLFSKQTVLDCTSGYRAANEAVIAHFSKDYPVDYPEPESLVDLSKHGFSYREVAVRMFERSGGASSISPLKSVYYMIKVSLAIIITGTQKGVR